MNPTRRRLRCCVAGQRCFVYVDPIRGAVVDVDGRLVLRTFSTAHLGQQPLAKAQSRVTSEVRTAERACATLPADGDRLWIIDPSSRPASASLIAIDK